MEKIFIGAWKDKRGFSVDDVSAYLHSVVKNVIIN